MESVKKSVYLQRQGSTDQLYLRGLPEGYAGSVIGSRIEMTFYENDVLVKKLSRKTNGLDFRDMERFIKNATGDNSIKLEPFIQSYSIAQYGHYTVKGFELYNDRDLVKSENQDNYGQMVDVTDFTVKQVIFHTGIKLDEYFKDWRVEKVSEMLKNPSEHILSVRFKDFYAAIHNNHYKADYEKLLPEALNKLEPWHNKEPYPPNPAHETKHKKKDSPER